MIEKNIKPTVLIAMTGGLESTVAAYLLKKQGYKCIGIGIQLFSPEKNPGPFEEVVIKDLNKIKAICVYLDIPFYAVDASEIFSYLVLDPVVGRVLSGQTFEPLVFLNLALMEVLLAKAEKFNAQLISTGHYAKVLKNQRSGVFELVVAQDLEKDQSYFLSRLSQRHLERMILPLAEIRRNEVEKIGELIKVEYLLRSKKNVHHIMRDPRMIKLVEELSSKDLRRTGSIYDYREESSICEHLGIHRFYVGQKNLPSKNETPIDPLKEVVSIIPYKGNVFIDYPERLRYTHALVCRFVPETNLDMTLPLSVYVKMSSGGLKVPCKLYFKNNDTCLVDFGIERPGLLVAGQLFVFYNKAFDKGRVLGSAILEVGGTFAHGELNTLPINKKNAEEEEQKAKQIKNDEKLQF